MSINDMGDEIAPLFVCLECGIVGRVIGTSNIVHSFVITQLIWIRMNVSWSCSSSRGRSFLYSIFILYTMVLRYSYSLLNVDIDVTWAFSNTILRACNFFFQVLAIFFKASKIPYFYCAT